MKFHCWGFVRRCLWVAFILVCIAVVAYIINDWFMDDMLGRVILWQVVRVALSIAVVFAGTAMVVTIHAIICELLSWKLNGSKDRPGPSPRVGAEAGQPAIKLTRALGQVPLWSTEHYRTSKEVVINQKISE